MKEWNLEEFLKECEELCWNPYTYDYNRMPSGFCNGHKVEAYKGSWHSIAIDDVICNMAYCSEKCPDGSTGYIYHGRNMSWKEYVREKLTEAVQPKREYDPDVYGYVNGEPVYSADEFVYKVRGFGAIETDKELMAYAEKVTNGWSNCGWKQSFTHYYLSDYCYDRPRNSLTNREFSRLKELQKKAREEWEAAEKAREWKLITTYYYADNSEEELWEDKNGVQKIVMTVGAHGDAC